MIPSPERTLACVGAWANLACGGDGNVGGEQGIERSQQVSRLPARWHFGGDRHSQGVDPGICSAGGHCPDRSAGEAAERPFQFTLYRAALALALPAAILRAIELQREEKGAAHEARNNSRNARPGQLA